MYHGLGHVGSSRLDPWENKQPPPGTEKALDPFLCHMDLLRSSFCWMLFAMQPTVLT